ncbi:DUF3515 domain-containing protein [Corynebacterium sp. YIM 101645]|uniref:DUF3515 domain-containing protein n=1 Tax=Corynebacterium lemuris TaxID=1859292 RepID=A0ABT2FXC3_9CORY|nr:DUF3515 domain-containing protein [Corynebacterium lemuris]MCS5479895.1 DUF3515 domain-containing protein [Corynebacterium lemuris]
MSSAASSQPSRSGKTAVYLSLVLAVALVIGVVLGAKVVFDRAAKQPVVMSELPAPLADSRECADFIAGLPEELVGHDRAEIVEPVPAGAAAWTSSSVERVTLRCGVDLPFQYTDYAPTETIEGVEWLRITDATPGSTLSSWYTVDREQVVAVTADEESLGRAGNPVADLAENVSALPAAEHEPYPAPLSQLAAAENTGDRCVALMAALPETIAEDYGRIDVAEPRTAAWTAPGLEPVVLRCGVAPPENYRPGLQLNQVNDIVWFEDTTLANGTTSSTWFALGRDIDIAVSVPQATGNAAVVELGEIIAAETDTQ